MPETGNSERTIFAEAGLRAAPLGPGAVRLTWGLAQDGEPQGRPWVSEVFPGLAAPRDPTLGPGIVLADGAATIVLPGSETPLSILELRETSRAVTRLVLATHPGERFYGLGERFDRFARSAGTVRLHARESPAFTQQRQSYSAIPLIFSSRGYALLLLNSHPSTWRIRPERRRVEVTADGPGADCLVITGTSPKEILSTYTMLAGRPSLPPRWALGLWATEFPQEGEQAVLDHIEAHRAHHIPLDAVILDYHWEERFHNFRWRASLFPNPARLIERLKARAVRLGLIFTPFLNTRHGRLKKRVFNLCVNSVPRARMMDDERDLEGFEQARRAGLLAHEQTAWWFGAGGLLDFTNPAACNWWNARLRPLVDQGVAFFKNDDGEYLPDSARSHLGLSGRELHNLYAFFYGRALSEGMRALDDRRPFIYARSAWAGSQRYPGMFLGDQTPTFAHMRATLRAGLNMSLTAFTWWGADIFGLSGKTDPETHMRYAQWAMLNPLARYFWRPPDLDDTRLPWSHGQLAEESFRNMAELRYRLLPYLYSLAWQAQLSGVPMVRPMMLEFPQDERLGAVDDQYMLGGLLLVAPVLMRGARERRVLLPEGEWHDFWSGESHRGPGEILHPAPLDRLPLLIRGGAILPLGPALQHIPDDHVFDSLALHLWPPYAGESILYDDDGRTRAYEGGGFTRMRVQCRRHDNITLLKVDPLQGAFAGQPRSLKVQVVFHRATPPRSVMRDRTLQNDWEYDASSRELRLQGMVDPQRGCEWSIAAAAE